MVIHLWQCLRASSGRGLCLLRSVDSLYTERLGVPGLPGPCGSRHSGLVATRFPLCGCPLFSLADEIAHWRYPPFLICPRCVRLPSTLLFSGPFTHPGFFRILCLVASCLVCRRLLLHRRAPLVLLALLGNGPRLLLLLASLARRGRITRISAVSSSPGGSGGSGGQRKVQGRSQPDGTALPMRMLSGLPPLWRQCLIMRQSWVVVVLWDDYCVPFKDSPPPCFHTQVAFTASRVGSPRAPALRQEVEARLAKETLGITLGPGPGFTVVSSWWNRPLTAGVPGLVSLTRTSSPCLLRFRRIHSFCAVFFR